MSKGLWIAGLTAAGIVGVAAAANAMSGRKRSASNMLKDGKKAVNKAKHNMGL